LTQQRAGGPVPRGHRHLGCTGRVPLRSCHRPVERAPAPHVEELRDDADLLAGRAADGAGGVLRGRRGGRCRSRPTTHEGHPADPPALRRDHRRAHREREPARLRPDPGTHGRWPVLLLRGRRGVHLPHRLRPRLRRRGPPARVRLGGRMLLRGGHPGHRSAAGVGDEARRRPESEARTMTLTSTRSSTSPSPAERAPASASVPRRRLKRSERIALVVSSVVLLPLAVVWIYPFVWVFSSSVQSTAEIFGSLNPFTSTLRLDNYVRAWEEANMGRYFLNTVFVTAVSILVSVTVNALLGYVLGRYVFPGKKLIYVLLALVVFLPEGYTVIPIFDLIYTPGLAGSLWGIALAEAGGVSVIVVLLFTGYFAQLPKELEEAATMDGAGFLRIFARIYLPLAKPVIATAVILQFMHAW